MMGLFRKKKTELTANTLLVYGEKFAKTVSGFVEKHPEYFTKQENNIHTPYFPGSGDREVIISVHCAEENTATHFYCRRRMEFLKELEAKIKSGEFEKEMRGDQEILGISELARRMERKKRGMEQETMF